MRETGAGALRIWGEVHQLRTGLGPTPEIKPDGLADRHRDELLALIKSHKARNDAPSGGTAKHWYPHVPAIIRVQDDPPQAAFIFLTVERFFGNKPALRALAWHHYVLGRHPSSFRGPSAKSGRTAERRLSQMRWNIGQRFCSSVHDEAELSIAEETADEMRRVG